MARRQNCNAGVDLDPLALYLIRMRKTELLTGFIWNLAAKSAAIFAPYPFVLARKNRVLLGWWMKWRDEWNCALATFVVSALGLRRFHESRMAKIRTALFAE